MPGLRGLSFACVGLLLLIGSQPTLAQTGASCELPATGATVPLGTVVQVGGACVSAQGRRIELADARFGPNCSVIVNVTGLCDVTVRQLEFASGGEVVVFGSLRPDAACRNPSVRVEATRGVDGQLVVADLEVNTTATSAETGASARVAIGPDNHWTVENRTDNMVPRNYTPPQTFAHWRNMPFITPFLLAGLVTIAGPNAAIVIQKNTFGTTAWSTRDVPAMLQSSPAAARSGTACSKTL